VKISQLSPDDAVACAEALTVFDSARDADCPDAINHTAVSYAGLLRYGWDGVPPRNYLARDDSGRPVAVLAVDLPTYDNTHVAWFDVTVAPEFRRRGIGSELLGIGLDMAREAGRRSAGIDGWDLPAGVAFAAKHGFEQKSADVRRRQLFADLDWNKLDLMYDDALAAAGDYELLRVRDAVPDDLLDDVVTMTAAINDAPTDDLDIEDEVFTAERIRAFETAMVGWDRRLYRVIARHKRSGEFGGHSLVGVEHERPHVGWQLDTAVLRAHRGHRLGMLVKIELLRWLREAEPQLASIDTWNAESNQHMIAVNDAMGYRIVARGIQYQRSL